MKMRGAGCKRITRQASKGDAGSEISSGKTQTSDLKGEWFESVVYQFLVYAKFWISMKNKKDYEFRRFQFTVCFSPKKKVYFTITLGCM